VAFRRTTSKASRIKEFLNTKNVPNLTEEEVDVIEEAGEKLHKRVYMRHVFEQWLRWTSS